MPLNVVVVVSVTVAAVQVVVNVDDDNIVDDNLSCNRQRSDLFIHYKLLS